MHTPHLVVIQANLIILHWRSFVQTPRICVGGGGRGHLSHDSHYLEWKLFTISSVGRMFWSTIIMGAFMHVQSPSVYIYCVCIADYRHILPVCRIKAL